MGHNAQIMKTYHIYATTITNENYHYSNLSTV